MFKRVLLKISGESLCNKNGYGIDKPEIETLAKDIKEVKEMGVELAIVIGGGNIVRGKQLSSLGINRIKADNIGMIATIINALVLEDELERLQVETRVLSTFFIQQVVEPYILSNCLSHLSKKRIVILSGGTGSPYFTTDTAAALRAIEIKADVLLKATKVNGVYSDDPELNKDAKKFDSLTYMEVLNKNLKVMDSTAITLCMENNLPIVVFNIKTPKNIQNIIKGSTIGTYIGSNKYAY